MERTQSEPVYHSACVGGHADLHHYLPPPSGLFSTPQHAPHGFVFFGPAPGTTIVSTSAEEHCCLCRLTATYVTHCNVRLSFSMGLRLHRRPQCHHCVS